MLARLPEIFPRELNKTDGYKLYKALNNFTRLAFSFKLEREQISEMRKLVQDIIDCCHLLFEKFQLDQLAQSAQSNPGDEDLGSYKVVPKVCF